MNGFFRKRNYIILFLMLLMTQDMLMAQCEVIKLPDTRLTLLQIIAQVEEQTPFRFAYDPVRVEGERVVPVEGSRLNLGEVLRFIESETGYTLSIRNQYVLIDPRSKKSDTPNENKAASNTASTGDVYVPNTVALVAQASRPRPVQETENLPDTDIPTLPDTLDSGVTERLLSTFYSDTLDLLKFTHRNRLPLVALKADLLYGFSSLTPNLAAEVGLGDRHTVELSGSYNPWKRKASLKDNKKRLHWSIRPEYRYWFCERFNGHFIGGHAFYSRYNVSGHQIPLLFNRKYRYDGYAVGAGFVYGYYLPVAGKWGFEFSVAVGAAYLNYDRYSCRLCSRANEETSKTYFGPTRASINLVYLIR